jgi:hypothetical protein
LQQIKNEYTIYHDDLWVSFVPKTDKARSWIRDYRGKGHDWNRAMASCVDYEGGITFPYNRVNKFKIYVKVKLRKDNGSKKR